MSENPLMPKMDSFVQNIKQTIEKCHNKYMNGAQRGKDTEILQNNFYSTMISLREVINREVLKTQKKANKKMLPQWEYGTY